MSTTPHDSQAEARRYASDGSGVIHEVTEIVNYTSPDAYYLALCGGRVACRSADVWRGREVPGMLCRRCAAAATS